MDINEKTPQYLACLGKNTEGPLFLTQTNLTAYTNNTNTSTNKTNLDVMVLTQISLIRS
jgi:hypothetical protein